MGMELTSLTSFIKEGKLIEPLLYDNLRYELDKHVYYYGQHFISPFENLNDKSVRKKLNKTLKSIFFLYKSFRQTKEKTKTRIVSNAYFNFNEKLENAGYQVFTPSWALTKNSNLIAGSYQLFKLIEQVKTNFQEESFNYLIGDEFRQKLESLKEQLTLSFLNEDIKALIVPNDVSFFENYSINIFKNIKRPSFIFLHGLPGRYNSIDENRTDYLIVWGEKIKKLYIDAGISENKILVSGHPYYASFLTKSLRFDLSNILVLAKIGVGSPHSTGMTLHDRGCLIVYLLSIQSVLKKLNVTKVRLRLHPSANPEWHFKFIDRNFFVLDTAPLPQSLEQASLVIGPTSSVFLEALAYGVNYLVYEPNINKTDLLNEKLVPPFDGSEAAVPVAGCTDELEEFIQQKRNVDTGIFKEYIQETFDIGFLNESIK